MTEKFVGKGNFEYQEKKPVEIISFFVFQNFLKIKQSLKSMPGKQSS